MVTEEDIARLTGPLAPMDRAIILARLAGGAGWHLIKVHEEEDYLVCEVGHGASRVQGVLVYRRVLGRHYCLQGHRLYPF